MVVTGASSGIGKSIADYFSTQGYFVYGVSRSYPAQKTKYPYLLCDVSKEDMVQKTMDEISSKAGKIDVLINCAGMGISGAIEYTTLDEAKRIFDINVIGMFLFTKASIPLLRQSEQAKIINIGSVAGDLMIPFQAFYSMTKAAVHAFSEALRMELKPFHIDVACVLPGDTKTSFTQNREQPQVMENDLYHDRIKRSIARMEHDEQNGKSPFTVVKVVRKLVKRRSMPVKVTVGIEYKLFVFLKRLLPKRFENWILYQMYGK